MDAQGGRTPLGLKRDLCGPWSSLSPDGRHLAISEQTRSKDYARDLRILEVEGDDRAGWRGTGVVSFEANEFFPVDARFSPDGKWLAYSSAELGSWQVFVQRFPLGGGKRRISNDTGISRFPVWLPAAGK